MTITGRYQLAKDLHSVGEYNFKPLITSVLGFISGLTVFATLTPERLPAFMLPYHPYLIGIGRTAAVIGMLSGGVLAQMKDRVLPKPDEGVQ